MLSLHCTSDLVAKRLLEQLVCFLPDASRNSVVFSLIPSYPLFYVKFKFITDKKIILAIFQEFWGLLQDPGYFYQN